MRLVDKTAIVTGGASGIGAASVVRLLAEGARVLAVDTDADGLERLRRASGDAAPRLQRMAADVAAPAIAERAVAQVVDAFGRLDVLVCSAAVSVGRKLADTPDEEWERVFEVNVHAAFRWFRAALAPMQRKRSGVLIAIASQLAVAGARSTCAYAASKGAVLSMVRAVALDYAEQGIRANAVLPGATATPFIERAFARAADPEAAREALRRRHPMGRFARAEEIAAAVAFLAADDASFVTGAALPVDGGFLAG
ncbi:MAG: SDR family oxidoreductase [Burkholderiales bacterium]|nr:SDR family oxidoreductase [Burkholderiales bacterium]